MGVDTAWNVKGEILPTDGFGQRQMEGALQLWHLGFILLWNSRRDFSEQYDILKHTIERSPDET